MTGCGDAHSVTHARRIAVQHGSWAMFEKNLSRENELEGDLHRIHTHVEYSF